MSAAAKVGRITSTPPHFTRVSLSAPTAGPPSAHNPAPLTALLPPPSPSRPSLSSSSITTIMESFPWSDAAAAPPCHASSADSLLDAIDPASVPGSPVEPSVHAGVHVLVDNNNLFHGAQLHENGAADRSVRVSIKEFATLASRHAGPDVRWRLVTGQMRSQRIATEWGRHGYVVNDTTRGRGGKLDDDSVRHVSSLMATPVASGRFVMATGDGGTCFGAVTFPDVVEALLQNGWEVVVLAWHRCLNFRYREMEGKYPALSVVLLDAHRSFLSFSAGVLPATAPVPRPRVEAPGRPPVVDMPVPFPAARPYSSYFEHSKATYRKGQVASPASVSDPGLMMPTPHTHHRQSGPRAMTAGFLSSHTPYTYTGYGMSLAAPAPSPAPYWDTRPVPRMPSGVPEWAPRQSAPAPGWSWPEEPSVAQEREEGPRLEWFTPFLQ